MARQSKKTQKDEESSDEELKQEKKKQEKSSEYNERDLDGLKVGHDLEALEEGSEQVLVLQDKNVLDDDEEDMLVNVNMLDSEKAAANIKERRAISNKTTLYDDEEESTLLPHYQRMLDGPQTKVLLKPYVTSLMILVVSVGR